MAPNRHRGQPQDTGNVVCLEPLKFLENEHGPLSLAQRAKSGLEATREVTGGLLDRVGLSRHFRVSFV